MNGKNVPDGLEFPHRPCQIAEHILFGGRVRWNGMSVWRPVGQARAASHCLAVTRLLCRQQQILFIECTHTHRVACTASPTHARWRMGRERWKARTKLIILFSQSGRINKTILVSNFQVIPSRRHVCGVGVPGCHRQTIRSSLRCTVFPLNPTPQPNGRASARIFPVAWCPSASSPSTSLLASYRILNWANDSYFSFACLVHNRFVLATCFASWMESLSGRATTFCFRPLHFSTHAATSNSKKSSRSLSLLRNLIL